MRLKTWILTIALGVILLVVLLLGGILPKFWVPKSPSTIAPEMVMTFTFPDGDELEVLGISVGTRVVEVAPEPKKLIPYFQSKGMSDYLLDDFVVKREEADKSVFRCSAIYRNAPNALFMELRFKKLGIGQEIPSHFLKYDMISPDRRLFSSTGTKKKPVFWIRGAGIEGLTSAMVAARMPLLIQYRTAQNNWINLPGPFLFCEDWKDRYMVVLPAWHRNAPNLDFRALRSDGAIMEFSLPSPDYKKVPETIAASSLPWSHNGGDYQLSIKEISRFENPGNHPAAAILFDWEIDGKSAHQPTAAFQVFDSWAEDEWGNHVPFDTDTIRKDIWRSAALPGTSQKMKVHLKIRRTQDAPQLDYQGYQVAEGVVSGDGKTVDFTLLPDAKRFDLSPMAPGIIKPKTKNSEDDRDQSLLTYKLSGKGSLREMLSSTKFIGEPQQWQYLVFSNQSSKSGGFYGYGNGGSYGLNGDQFEFRREPVWAGTSEMLKPGAHLKIGIHGSLKEDEVTFDVELPMEVSPR